MDVRNYPIVIEPLAADMGGGYVARVPRLPGCLSDGATPDEALHNIYDAIACWIEVAHAAGEQIPAPGPDRAAA